MPVCHLDFETRSTVNLPRQGVDVYIEAPSTEVIVACWAVDSGPVRRWNISMGEEPLYELAQLAEDPEVTFAAHNAHFERKLWVVFRREHGLADIALGRWDCTMARSLAAGLPAALEHALGAMGSPYRKDKDGHRLMMQMCKPRSVKSNGEVIWWEDADRLERLTNYCVDDVIGERWLDNHLPPLTGFEKKVWQADARMNDRGIPLDLDFIDRAIEVSSAAAARLNKELEDVTDGAVKKATQLNQLRDFVMSHGVELEYPEDEDDEEGDEPGDVSVDKVPLFRKENLLALLSGDLPNEKVRRAIEIRLEAGKTSVRKLRAMKARMCKDGRIRGSLRYYGAATGRWSAAGGGVQFQNLPRPGGFDRDWAYELIMGADPKEADDVLNTLYASTLDVVSKMLRSVIRGKGGKKIRYIDYSQVEARGVAWLAGEDKLVRAFANGEKIYEDLGAKVFGVPIESVTKDSLERFVGKGGILGCGYGMGPPKFQTTCAKQGTPISLELAKRTVYTYREDNPAVPRLWKAMNRAAMLAIKNPGKVFPVAPRNVIRFKVWKGWLVMRLPNGGCIYYRKPSIQIDEKFGEQVSYWGWSSIKKKFCEQRTYGGRLTENAVQRMCRDILAGAILKLEDVGYEVILLVHDEGVEYSDFGTLEEMQEIMQTVPEYLPGFPLDTDASENVYYSK